MNLDLISEIGSLFDLSYETLSFGFKYLGFNLKPTNYTSKDLQWMVEKVEKRIRGWSTRWLLKGADLF